MNAEQAAAASEFRRLAGRLREVEDQSDLDRHCAYAAKALQPVAAAFNLEASLFPSSDPMRTTTADRALWCIVWRTAVILLVRHRDFGGIEYTTTDANEGVIIETGLFSGLKKQARDYADLCNALAEKLDDANANTVQVASLEKPGPEFFKRADAQAKYFKVWAHLEKPGNGAKADVQVSKATHVNKDMVGRIRKETRPPTEEERNTHKEQPKTTKRR